jgi:hypothetical protein
MSPHDSVLMTQKLHWMLGIGHAGIERRDIINDDIGMRLQTLLQLRDMEHPPRMAVGPIGMP